jgi:hypothetical protein
MRLANGWYRRKSRFSVARITCVAILASAAVRAEAQAAADSHAPEIALLNPGDAGLSPSRVSESTDTLSILVTAPNAAERSYATLLRRTSRMQIGGVSVVRETQHYEFANGTRLDDTLDVRASTLEPIRYSSVDHQGAFDVSIEGTRIKGWRADSLGARTNVDVTATHPFFVSIMSEAFIASLPLDAGDTINIPEADPPAATVRLVTLRATRIDTLRTARGDVPCLRIVGPGNTETWIARNDHHLVRMHWVLGDRTSVWKLPTRDATMR